MGEAGRMYGPGECKSKLQDERRVVKNEFQPNVAKCRQMSPNVAKCRQMSPNVAKCRQMSPNVAKCRRVDIWRPWATVPATWGLPYLVDISLRSYHVTSKRVTWIAVFRGSERDCRDSFFGTDFLLYYSRYILYLLF